MVQELTIRGPSGAVRRFRLEGEEVGLGRSHENQLCYPDDASLSRRHLQFRRASTGWTVRDLDSKNGTLVNGSRLSGPHLLRPGDRVEAGQLVLTCDRPEVKPPPVTFFGGAGAAVGTGTIMTSLEAILSSSAPSKATTLEPEPAAAPMSFDHPAVVALIRAGRELSGQKPLPDLFRLILDLSLDAVGAERGALLTVEAGELVPQAVRGDGLKISTAVRDLVLEQKNSLLVRDTLLDDAFKMRQSIHDQQVRSMIAVPLQTEDRVIGMIYVDSRFFVREMSQDDLNLLTVLANVAAVRIEHQRLAEVERKERETAFDLEKAAEIQMGLLPAEAPAVEGFELAGRNAACKTVGGDYYDFFPMEDGRCALALGDVAGKGMPAALLMTSLQARVQLLCEDVSSLARMMERLDRSVATHCPDNRFITFFFGVLEPGGRLRYCNAGHNPPLLVRSATGEIEWLKAGGTFLGLFPHLGYEEAEVRMEPGDILAIYSDGVPDAMNLQSDDFGEARLSTLLQARRSESAPVIADALRAAVTAWTAGAPPTDDVTLVIVRKL